MKPFVKTYFLFVLSFALAATAASLASAQSNDRTGAAPRASSGFTLVLPLEGQGHGGGVTIGGLSIGGLSGAGQPDLVIEPRFGGTTGMPGTGFCGFWQNGQNHTMVFYIRNQGSMTVPGTQVQISFGTQSFVQNVAALPPGGQRVVTQVIPPEAWRQPNHPIVDFVVTADPLQNMSESNEGNNSAQDRCRGPAI